MRMTWHEARIEPDGRGTAMISTLDSRPVHARVCVCVLQTHLKKTSHTEKMNKDFETDSETLSRPTYGQN